uniref:Uncharacterized protein n=1 Tax=virus sp. ctEfN2 TaxID=2825810 RepID=A0A8S5RM67_9VIRU|nr:MAG TPA: hypothetical protein [virus sp. ctEfN2]
MHRSVPVQFCEVSNHRSLAIKKNGIFVPMQIHRSVKPQILNLHGF